MSLILGISISRKAVATALLSYSCLINWNTKTFYADREDSKSKAVLHIISQLINKYPIEAIAIKIPENPERFNELIKLIGAINVITEKKDLKPKFYTLSDLKNAFGGISKINRQRLAELIMDKYSILTPIYRKAKKNNPFRYIKVFEAVAVADLCKGELDYKSK